MAFQGRQLHHEDPVSFPYQQGRIAGAAEVFELFDKWVNEIDGRVKGIGPKTKLELQHYFADRIKEQIEQNGNMIAGTKTKIIKDLPDKTKIG